MDNDGGNFVAGGNEVRIADESIISIMSLIGGPRSLLVCWLFFCCFRSRCTFVKFSKKIVKNLFICETSN